jgi:PAS domain S-box-containing protein
MQEFFKIFFTSDGFIPHGHCYLWKPGLVLLHMVSDSLIGLAYYSIPVMLVYFVRKRRDVPFDWIFLLFGAFIVACGTTHLLGVWTLWHPSYWLSGFIKAITALVSLGTAALLVPLIPKALALPSPSQLEAVNLALRNEIIPRQKAEEALQVANQQLEIRVRERTAELAKINESLQAEIEAHQQTEEALHRRQQQFKALVENAPDIITRFDRNLRHLYVNPAVELATGLSAEAFIGKTNRELGMPEELASYWEKGMGKVFETGQQQVIEFQFLTPSRLTHYQARIVPELAKDGSIESLLSISRDITAQKQVEEALKVSERQFSAIFNQAAVGIAQVGLDGQWLLINQKLGDIVGYTREELLERTFQDITYPDDLDADLAYVHQLLAGEIETYSMEKRYIRKNGSPVWINLNVSLVRNSLREPEYFIAVVQDISDRKLTEDALKQTQFCVDSATDAISWLGLDGSFIYVNDRMCRSLGYSRSELLSMSISDIDPDVPVTGRSDVWQAIQQDGSVIFESRHRTKNGRVFPVEIVANYLNFKGLEYACCFARDISDRKQREQEIHLLQTITQAISEASDFDSALKVALCKVCEVTGWNFGEVWIPHPLENSLELSSAWCSNIQAQCSCHESLNHFRRESEKLTFSLNIGIPGRVWASKQPEWIQDVSREPEAVVLRSQIAQDAGLKTALGVPILANVSAATSQEPQVLAVFVFFALESTEEDKRLVEIVSSVANQLGLVIQRKRAEEALRQREEQLRLVLQNMPVMMDAFDANGNIIIWNRESERVTGYSAQEMVGNPKAMELLYPNSDYRQQMMAAWVEQGNDYRDWEWEITGKDGSIKVISWSNISQQFPVPSWSSWGVGVDITDRKHAEQEIRELNETLERRVIERTVELEATNKELEAFSYSVSHDLRAPLRGIDGFSQALLDRYADKLDDKGKHYLQRIRAGTQRMGELIDDLLKLSRVTRSEMRRTEVDLSALVHNIAAELQQTQPERQVEWSIVPGLVANGDARLLRIALENLLNNAWKFTSSTIHPQIKFDATLNKDGKAVYFVRDNGAGFDMTYANKLFGAFQRLHSTTQFSGTGVGLATVQRIIHRHGGQVWAEGEVDQGATFYFTL